jgi:hypothetical protein
MTNIPLVISDPFLKYQSHPAPLLQILAPYGEVVLDSSGWNARMTPNTWHLVKITFAPSDSNHGTTTVYVDDTQAGSVSGSAYFDPNFGWNVRMGNFVGCIDELRISNIVR